MLADGLACCFGDVDQRHAVHREAGAAHGALPRRHGSLHVQLIPAGACAVQVAHYQGCNGQQG
jgi:hypothetical protein